MSAPVNIISDIRNILGGLPFNVHLVDSLKTEQFRANSFCLMANVFPIESTFAKTGNHDLWGLSLEVAQPSNSLQFSNDAKNKFAVDSFCIISSIVDALSSCPVQNVWNDNNPNKMISTQYRVTGVEYSPIQYTGISTDSGFDDLGEYEYLVLVSSIIRIKTNRGYRDLVNIES